MCGFGRDKGKGRTQHLDRGETRTPTQTPDAGKGWEQKAWA